MFPKKKKEAAGKKFHDNEAGGKRFIEGTAPFPDSRERSRSRSGGPWNWSRQSPPDGDTIGVPLVFPSRRF